MDEKIDIRVDQKRNTVVFTAGETFTYQQFEEAFNNAVNHDDYDKDMHIMWDLRNVKIIPMGKKTEDLKKIFHYVKANSESYGQGFKMAVVTSSDLVFGLSRMYEMISDSLPFERMVFKDFQKASNWLGWVGCTEDIQK